MQKLLARLIVPFAAGLALFGAGQAAQAQSRIKDIAAVEGVRNAGGDVQAVAVIVDRATGAAERVAEEAGVPYLYAFGKDELGLD